jgi:hypothetical protein
MSKKQNVLQEAERIVHGRGEKEYGHPRDNFQDEADGFSGYLHARGLLDRDKQLEPRDIAHFNILQKLMREGNSQKRDNLVDIAGYALTAERCEEE